MKEFRIENGNQANQTEPSRAYGRELAESGCARQISRVQAVELLVILFPIIPSMAFSFFIVKQADVRFEIMAATAICRDWAMMCLTLFFLWRNREVPEDIGWTSRNAGYKIVLGILLFAGRRRIGML